MSLRLRDTPVDRVTAGIGGGAVAVAAILRAVERALPGLSGLPNSVILAAHLVGALMLPLGLLVLALGVPVPPGRGEAERGAAGRRWAVRPGVLGGGGIVRALVALVAVLEIVALAATFVTTAVDAAHPGAARAWAVWFGIGAIDYVPLALLLVAGIALARTPGSTRYARYGIGALALLGVVEFAMNFALAIAYPILDAAFSGGAQVLAEPLAWLSRLLSLGAVATGVWFAWPWLAPRADRGAEAVRRIEQRHRDTTP